MDSRVRTTLTEQERQEIMNVEREIRKLREHAEQLTERVCQLRTADCSDDFFDKMCEARQKLRDAVYTVDQARQIMKA